MTALWAFLAVIAAFAVMALVTKKYLPEWKEKGFCRAPLIQRGEAFTPGERAVFSGGFLMSGITAGVLAGFLASLFEKEQLFTAVTGIRLFGGLFFVLLTAVFGLLEDRREVLGLSELLIAVRISVLTGIALCFLAALFLCGDRSTILVIPAWGQGDAGIFYLLFCLVLLAGMPLASAVQSEAGDIASVCAMFTGLSLAAAGGVLKSLPAAVLGAALAGCGLASLLYSFPPAKLVCGKGGGLFFGAAAAAAAMGCGVPMLLSPAALPLVIEGIFALVKLVWFAVSGKRITAGSFAGFLCQKGMSYRSVSLVMAGISFIGFVLTHAAVSAV
ncbi:MAG: hypothetical protein IJD13_09420 [Oscillospiraceae bacterium]|nr:hypothetical protein [Oscillospiraceae bacterium]